MLLSATLLCLLNVEMIFREALFLEATFLGNLWLSKKLISLLSPLSSTPRPTALGRREESFCRISSVQTHCRRGKERESGIDDGGAPSPSYFLSGGESRLYSEIHL